jgi:hypothetical protein
MTRALLPAAVGFLLLITKKELTKDSICRDYMLYAENMQSHIFRLQIP